MRNRFFLAIFISICFVSSYAQSDCEERLRTARNCKANKEYGRAVDYYNIVLRHCSDYVDVNKVKTELKECEDKLKPTSQKTSSGRVAVNKQESGRVTYEDMIEAEGNDRYEIRVTCEGDWFLATPKMEDWLEVVSQSENNLILKCAPNTNQEDRFSKISIICQSKGGSIPEDITIRQEGMASSKSTKRKRSVAQNNSSEPANRDLSITVKVTFEKGKAKPTFENVGKLLGLLEDNKNLGLQIEIPWCSERKIEVGIFNKYPMSLMKKRIKNITNYFVNSGIAKERISWSMNESTIDCDCAYAKVTELTKQR